MANEGGRPTDYNEEILTKAREYLKKCLDEEYRQTKTEGAQSTSYENKIRVKLPTIEGLALYIGIARSTVYKWIEEEGKSAFSDIIEELLAMQAERLLNNGLSGDYNPTIAKVLLTKHGYREAIDTDLTSKGEQISLVVSKASSELSTDKDE